LFILRLVKWSLQFSPKQYCLTFTRWAVAHFWTTKVCRNAYYFVRNWTKLFIILAVLRRSV